MYEYITKEKIITLNSILFYSIQLDHIIAKILLSLSNYKKIRLKKFHKL